MQRYLKWAINLALVLPLTAFAAFSCPDNHPQGICSPDTEQCVYGIYDKNQTLLAQPGDTSAVRVITELDGTHQPTGNLRFPLPLYICGKNLHSGGGASVSFVASGNDDSPTIGAVIMDVDGRTVLHTDTLRINSFFNVISFYKNFPIAAPMNVSWLGYREKNLLWPLSLPFAEIAPGKINPPVPPTDSQVPANGKNISSKSQVAYVQTERRVPTGGNIDEINPAPVLANKGLDVGKDYESRSKSVPRIHSWASGMIWAKNKEQYWTSIGQNTNHAFFARQSPVWADPLIAVYTSQPKHTENDGDRHDPIYNDTYVTPAWLRQDGTTSVNSINTIAGPPGFHLSTENPMAIFGTNYSGGTTADYYNYRSRVLQSNVNMPSLQVGVDQAGLFVDTLDVFPAASKDDPTTTAFANGEPPSDALAVSQGDWDIVFQMGEDDGPNLQMAIAQGSPYAQFTAQKFSAPNVITVGAVYLPNNANNCSRSDGNTYLCGDVTPVQQMTVQQQKIDYQIIYQQVNKVFVDAFQDNYDATSNGAGTNWVSFAVIWLDQDYPVTDNPKGLITSLNEKDHLTYYQLPISKQTQYFVIAALPNQIVPDKTAADYDADLAHKWAQALAPYAFNYYNGQSHVNFSVEPQNKVKVTYKPNLQNVGPAADTKTTIFMLQSYQYSPDNKQGGKSPVEQTSGAYLINDDNDCEISTKNGNKNCYWSVRGNLKPYSAAELHLTYIMPPILPYFSATELRDKSKDLIGEGDKLVRKANDKPASINLNDMTYWLASMQFQTLNSSQPAGMKFAPLYDQPGQMNDAYGLQQAYLSALLLMEIGQLDQPGIDKPVPDYVRAWYEREPMMHELDAELQNVFQYYFSSQPKGPVNNTRGVSSYVYAYHDDNFNHLTLYPAGTSPGAQPQSIGADLGGLYDSFGIASKLSDNNYTWGYLIAAAALDVSARQRYSAILNAPSSSPLYPTSDWLNAEGMGPAVDLMIQDVAYSHDINEWWVDASIKFPRLDFMDLWTGIAYTNAFIPAGDSLFGKQHNSAQEAQLTWSGIYLWGEVTRRKEIADLGAFLYTLGAYANNASFTGQNGDFSPNFKNSWESINGSYIPRVNKTSLPPTDDKSPRNDGYWNSYPLQMLTMKSDSSLGASAWDTIAGTSDYKPTIDKPLFYAAGVYQGRLWKQGEDGTSPLQALFNIIYPLTPSTLSVFGNTGNMKQLANSLLHNSDQPHDDLGYAGVLNQFLDALELNSINEVNYGWDYPRKEGNHPKNAAPQEDFSQTPFSVVLASPDRQSGFDWMWKKISELIVVNKKLGFDKAVTIYGNDGDSKLNLTAVLTAFMHNGDIGNGFLNFYVFDTYGVPTTDVNTYCITSGGGMQPMCAAFKKDGVLTYMAYNPNGEKETITVYSGEKASASHSVPAYTLEVWGGEAPPARPEPPDELVVLPNTIGATTATLQWGEKGYDAGRYKFALDPNSGGVVLGETSCGEDNKCSAPLSGLQPGTSYGVGTANALQLRANNGTESSDAADVPKFDTLPEKPAKPATPKNISVKAEQTTAEIAWEEDYDANLYRFKVKVLDAEGKTVVEDDNVNKLTYSVSNLNRDTPYKVEITAANGSAVSDPGKAEFRTKPAISPLQPPVLSSAISARTIVYVSYSQSASGGSGQYSYGANISGYSTSVSSGCPNNNACFTVSLNGKSIVPGLSVSITVNDMLTGAQITSNTVGIN